MTLFFLAVAAGFSLLGSTAYYLCLIAVVCAVVFIYRAVANIIKNKEDPAMYALHGEILSVYMLYWLLREYSAVFYLGINNLSLAVSGAVGWFISRPIAMGMTYSGVDLVLLFVISTAVTDMRYAGRKFIHFILDCVLFICVWVFYIGFWTVLAENSIMFGLHLFEPLTGPLDYRFLLFILFTVVYSFRHRTISGDLPASGIFHALTGSKRKVAMVICSQTIFCCFCAVALLYNPAAPLAPAGKRIVFWDSGIDFSVPVKGLYGLDRVGMFGVLPEYLENRGYTCAITGGIDTGDLENAAALVIINPMISPDARTVEAIAGFVKNGGGVLAVGDHTGDEQIRKPLNKILSPAGIEFNFDSAIPFQNLWPQAFSMRKSPIFSGIDERQLQIVVGASLICDFRSKPLLIGRTGFSDKGDVTNEADGYLGDMSFSRGERFGDLVLAAETRLGKGVYLALGDTTPLQNTVLAYSAPFIDNIFAYITGGAGSGDNRDAYVDTGGRESSDDAYIDYCLIESNNLPAFSSDKSGNATDGFIAGVLRAGMLPYMNINEKPSDALNDRSKNFIAAVINEPAVPYDDSDIMALKELLDTGGSLILLGSYRSPDAFLDFCAGFGVSFDDLPIGRIAPTANPEMAFWDACPVLFQDMYNAETLISIWDYPVISRAMVSKGEIIAFGDAGFIKNKNLESIGEYREGNVAFVEAMLERAKTHFYAEKKKSAF